MRRGLERCVDFEHESDVDDELRRKKSDVTWCFSAHGAEKKRGAISLLLLKYVIDGGKIRV